jgi:hypothetical protein
MYLEEILSMHFLSWDVSIGPFYLSETAFGSRVSSGFRKMCRELCYYKILMLMYCKTGLKRSCAYQPISFNRGTDSVFRNRSACWKVETETSNSLSCTFKKRGIQTCREPSWTWGSPTTFKQRTEDFFFLRGEQRFKQRTEDFFFEGEQRMFKKRTDNSKLNSTNNSIVHSSSSLGFVSVKLWSHRLSDLEFLRHFYGRARGPLF